jgi:GTP-binding protein
MALPTQGSCRRKSTDRLAMIIKSAEFVTSAVKPQHYPPPEYPEIAFAGRSNVGKSSLINTLVNRKRLVKTSNTPGRTQLINFFLINNNLSFVDLPGYGYARVPAAIQKQWGPMIETYLASREALMGVVLLVDIRRTPRQEEHDLLRWLDDHQRPYRIVVTKADKLSRNKQVRPLRVIAEQFECAPEKLLLFSAKTGQGLQPLWRALEAMITIPS